jgi:gluconokinase
MKNANHSPLVWVILGVAGSGKTSVGRRLAQHLECDFLEGDRRHPVANIQKMYAHQPLDDRDRHAWLLALDADIRRAVNLNRETVLTCSGLKVSYRRQLTAPGRVQLIWLEVPLEELQRRLTNRQNHFMTRAMLESQLEAFEPLLAEENAMILDGRLDQHELVKTLLTQITDQFPMIKSPWWERS